MIRASGEEVYELEVGAGFWTWREGGECYEHGGILVNLCRGLPINNGPQSQQMRDEEAGGDQTGRYFLHALPRGAGEEQALEGDVNVGMILLDPVENLGGFFEGQYDEQMLRFGVGTATHGER